MSQEREFPINNLIKAVEVHNEFYKEPRELFEWVKASLNNLPLAGVKVITRYPGIKDEWKVLTRAGIIEEINALYNIEWLKPIKPESITNSSIEQMAEELYPLDNPKKNMFHDNSGQYSRRESFIAGCKAIIELNKKALNLEK